MGTISGARFAVFSIGMQGLCCAGFGFWWGLLGRLAWSSGLELWTGRIDGCLCFGVSGLFWGVLVDRMVIPYVSTISRWEGFGSWS